jgi:hypothetical protein
VLAGLEVLRTLNDTRNLHFNCVQIPGSK